MATLAKELAVANDSRKISITALISNLMRYVAVVEGDPYMVVRLAC